MREKVDEKFKMVEERFKKNPLNWNKNWHKIKYAHCKSKLENNFIYIQNQLLMEKPRGRGKTW